MVQYACDRCGEVMPKGHSVRVGVKGDVREGIDGPSRYDANVDERYNFELCDGCKVKLFRFFAKWRPRKDK